MKRKFEISKAVIEKDTKYLLLKRASSTSYPDTWDFAGGRDDPGETHRQSVIREVKEETSFNIEPGEVIRKIYYEDEKFQLTFHYFTPKTITEVLKLSSDHSEYIWVSKKEIKELNLHPSVSEFFL